MSDTTDESDQEHEHHRQKMLGQDSRESNGEPRPRVQVCALTHDAPKDGHECAKCGGDRYGFAGQGACTCGVTERVRRNIKENTRMVHTEEDPNEVAKDWQGILKRGEFDKRTRGITTIGKPTTTSTPIHEDMSSRQEQANTKDIQRNDRTHHGEIRDCSPYRQPCPEDILKDSLEKLSPQDQRISIAERTFYHILDKRIGATKLEIGPGVMVKRKSDKLVGGPSPFVVPEGYCCLIIHPVQADKDGKVIIDKNGIAVNYSGAEYREGKLTFPLYPGEILFRDPSKG